MKLYEVTFYMVSVHSCKNKVSCGFKTLPRSMIDCLKE